MNEQGLLYRYLPTEIAPPKQMWERICAVLDEPERRALANLENIEIPPPKAAWENIVAVLDEQKALKKNTSLAESFLAMEVAPPPTAWENIQKALDTQAPVRKIGDNSKNIRRFVIGLAAAACLIGVIFTVVDKFGNRPNNNTEQQLATISKKDVTTPQTAIPSQQEVSTDRKPKNIETSEGDTENLARLEKEAEAQPISNEQQIDSEREFNLEKYKVGPVPNINTTNNKVATHIGKLRGENGNIIDKISDYNTSQGYVAAIGPNGNSVNVSTKLANMIEFFAEDSLAVKNEEYLDKVLREGNVWRQKFINWKSKVANADEKPSQMNFLDPIDLLNFLEKNK